MSYRVVMAGEDIYHHGIKGQRWGIRRYQNPDGTLTEAGKKRYSYHTTSSGDLVLEKGSELHRMTMNKNESNEGHAYASFTEDDVKHYAASLTQGFNAVLGSRKKKVAVYDMTLEATEDLIAPSEYKKVEAFISAYKKEPAVETAIDDVRVNRLREPREVERWGVIRTNIQEMGFPEDFANKYAAFSMALAENKVVRDTFFDELKKKGYNMVIDLNNASYESRAPIIVFDRGKSLKVLNVEDTPEYKSKQYKRLVNEDWKQTQKISDFDRTLPLSYKDWNVEERYSAAMLSIARQLSTLPEEKKKIIDAMTVKANNK